MIKRLLIANRGEIACRIIKTAQRRGIETLALYSDADQGNPHTQLADYAFRLPGELPADTYLNSSLILKIALENQVDAIHPGYGFLSENAEFCQACEANQLVFIGPSSQIIQQMGDKAAAKNLIQSIEVPTLKSYQPAHAEIEDYLQAAQSIGYPVLIKAIAGGGGKGMRIVEQEDQFTAAFQSAQSEALASFGNEAVLIEKYLAAPRHIEVQVFADHQGNCLTLSTRDCSIQRRYQKIIEEAPAPNLSQSLNENLATSAAKIVSALNYHGAGTIEFLVEGDHHYFMEMNTRLQVEHPVTEQIMGCDLVDWQISVAEGKSLPLTQQDLTPQGHSIEARIYAEDPYQQFLPMAGTLQRVAFPEPSPSVRIDSGIRAGERLSSYYDPMLAKIICHGDSRTEAIQQMTCALSQVQLAGIKTNLDFLKRILKTAPFHEADLNTAFIENHQATLFEIDCQEVKQSLIACAIFFVFKQSPHYRNTSQHSPWDYHNSWRLNGTTPQPLTLDLTSPTPEAKLFHIEVTLTDPWNNSPAFPLRFSYENNEFTVNAAVSPNCLRYNNEHQQITMPYHFDGTTLTLFGQSHTTQWLFHPQSNEDYQATSAQGSGRLGSSNRAPMSGRIVKLFAQPGDSLKAGDAVLTLEAMKMEHTLKIATDGKLTQLCCKENELVKENDTLYLYAPLSE